MHYTLCCDCPIPWPEAPIYPIDAPTANSTASVGGIASTSQVSLDAFVQQPSLEPRSETFDASQAIPSTLLPTASGCAPPAARLASFLARVRRDASVKHVDALLSHIEPVQELEERYRSVYKALSGLQSHEASAVLEALADNTILDNDGCLQVQQAYRAYLATQDAQPKAKQSLRDWVNSIELLA